MVAFSGSDPIGVLIGAKRPSGTLIHKIAVHPDHLRQGHGRHLLTSLSSKLAILGPPRIVAEVPEALDAACELFGACGYLQEAALTDYEWANSPPPIPDSQEHQSKRRLVIPLTVDDLAANDLLEPAAPVCWQRSVESLRARKDEIEGLALVSDERIEAYVLFVRHEEVAEILSFRSVLEDAGARLTQLLDRLRQHGLSTFAFPKVHQSEIPQELLATLGFRSTGAHRLYVTKAQSG